MRHTRRAVLGSAAAMATGLAGCTGSQDGGSGGDGSDGGSEPTPTGTSEPTPTATPEPTSTDTATPTPEATAAADETVVVGPDGDLVFDPAELRVEVGATVLWRWDSGGHTVTVESQPDGADWRATGQETHESGHTHTHTFEVAGTHEYVCLPHESAGMVGSVTVGDAGTSGSSATVRVRDHPDLGEILVGSDGRTLYMFDRDTRGAGASTCSGDCAGAWPPLTVDGDPTAGDGVTAELATFEREDGSTQVAAGGWPLYYFANDGAPGDANGQGAGDVWWVLGPGGTPKRPEPTPTRTPTSDGGGGYY
jgi:plastocyanin